MKTILISIIILLGVGAAMAGNVYFPIAIENTFGERVLFELYRYKFFGLFKDLIANGILEPKEYMCLKHKYLEGKYQAFWVSMETGKKIQGRSAKKISGPTLVTFSPEWTQYELYTNCGKTELVDPNLVFEAVNGTIERAK